MSTTTERQQWLERRRSGIGGSDVAPILGMSKWRTAYDVWLSKTSETPEEDRTTMPMLLGNVLEPEVLRLYEQQTGVSVRRSRVLHKHATHGELIANVDATSKGRIIEAKTARSRDGWGDAGSDDVPEAYWLQVQHYLYVCQKPLADVAVMFLCDEIPAVSVYQVPVAPEYEDIAAELVEWWQRYVEGTEVPAPVTSDECSRVWRQSRLGSTIAATGDVMACVDRLKAAKAHVKTIEEEIDHLETELKTRMVDAEAIVGPSGKPVVTWKTSSSERVDVKKVREVLPADLVAQCVVVSESRRFLVK